MSVYADASVLVPIFVAEPFTDRIERFIDTGPELLISDFTATEFASAISRRVRMRDIGVDNARAAFAAFDAWVAQGAQRVNLMAADLSAAEGFLRRLDLALRAPDALHIAIARRLGAELATFDERMAENAMRLSAPLAEV